MSAQLQTAFDAVRTAMHTERTARAQGSASRQAHFAAVMGRSIDSLDSTRDWSVHDTLIQNEDLQGHLRESRFSLDERQQLNALVEAHIQWLLCECANTLHVDLRAIDHPAPNPSSPNPSFHSGPSAGGSSSNSGEKSSDPPAVPASVETDVGLEEAEVDSQLDALLECIKEEARNSVLSASRVRTITEFDKQQTFIESKAVELSFVTMCLEQVRTQVAALKVRWLKGLKEPKALYTSEEYKTLQCEKSAMEKDQLSHETDLQRYFDNATQGSSVLTSSLNKTDKIKLTLTTDLESRKAGFRQIQLIDLYCLGRGNEMWAIIPSLHRIGHNVDPTLCMHWRPTVEEVPETLRPFWVEQSSAFAKKLLGICTPSMRSNLLGSHTYGTKKMAYKASESCGVSIYWVMVQLFHPIDRSRRSQLETELAGCAVKFKRGRGDPAVHLPELRVKQQEAMDIGCRLKWDVVAVPLIQALLSRDPLYTVRLEPLLLTPPSDPDDTAIEYGELINTISIATNTLNEGSKKWDEQPAKQAAKATSVETKMQKEIQDLRSALASLKKDAGRPQGNQKSNSNSCKPGFCKVVGCSAKVVGWTSANNWALCGTWLLKLKGTGKPLKLKDGRTFGRNAKSASRQLAEMEEDKSITLPNSKSAKQKKAKKAKKKALDAKDSDNASDKQVEEREAKRARVMDPAEEILYYEG